MSNGKRENALGLVATDIIRLMLESNTTPETMKFNSKNFIPHVLRKSSFWDNFLRSPLDRAISRGWKYTKQNPGFVKGSYIQQLTELVPDYGAEIYSVLIDEGGKVYEVELAVNPFHPHYPGLRIRIKKSKDDWTRICGIEDLCYISMRSDETVEISRQNGVPQYIQFSSKAQRYSFVSLLDGYYRLSEKWTFNLCKDLSTPSLLNLRAMKCHGPVNSSFAHEKLEEKSNNDVGCYIIRECETTYDVYYVDVWISTKSVGSENISTFKIKKNDEGLFILEGWKETFENISLLLSHHAKENRLNFRRCIPPSEYDESNLLLCRQENGIPKFVGKFTTVTLGHLRRSCTDSRAVAVKRLRRETKLTHLEYFLSQCDKFLYWQHDAIVSTIGMILTNPTALVMEWLPLGTLDQYLEKPSMSIQEVDLVESAYHLARALWYLEDHKMQHGNIRCRNVFVAVHTESSFKIKLADPGLISYTDADIPWIPPECYKDYSLASKSVFADVYAYGTTLWEMFSYGAKPLAHLSPSQAREFFYHRHQTLTFPANCLKEMRKLIEECWHSDNRPRPQTIVRDVNQILYEVYNSRRSHSYAMIDPAVVPEPESPVKPPLPERKPPVKETSLNILKKLKWPSSVPFKGFSYNSLSQSKSTLNAYSGNSTTSFLTDGVTSEEDQAQSGSLISFCNDTVHVATPPAVNDNLLRDKSWVIPFHHIIIKGKIGEGFYGEVSKAEYFNPLSLKNEIVAVKRIKATDTMQISVNELHSEMKIMKSLCHKNIVRIIGLVEEPETMLVMEYVDNGSLLNHLQSFRNNPEKLEYKELLRFALGVAEGMEYLETQNIVHRDLAARNILVGSSDSVKISDFGLAQEIKDHYYRMRTERNLPLRWYAIEAIVAQKFSHKSDVWSYGVTLWEIFSFGTNPRIDGVEDVVLHEALQRGQRLGIPPNCPSLVYSLMRRCWEIKSKDRPSFSEIIVCLNNIISELCA
ncbi:tyrosine-protein kinase hopscotch [Caerostris extrusa]|uniref:Tyrosine-protein kinase n=1 Tax=Caerostris extrusa TaxID=172846 RepID=A0AAV4SK11_CAEEX|nr:tyrosine-protein kinase hopscotch [Caerostris extrusa]